MDDCIFCKIGKGEMPASVVYEDDRVVAFDDINPQAPIHTLIIPRAHYTSLNNDITADDLSAIFGAVQHVARIKGIGTSGYRVIVNNGHDANQSVGHLHVHVLGGRAMSHRMLVFAQE